MRVLELQSQHLETITVKNGSGTGYQWMLRLGKLCGEAGYLHGRRGWRQIGKDTAEELNDTLLDNQN